MAVVRSGGSSAATSVRTRQPGSVTSVVTGTPAGASAGTARLLLASAPAAVVANAASHADVTRAAAIARHAHAPLLLLTPGTGTAPQAAVLAAAVRALATRAVLPVGIGAPALSADLPGVKVVGSAGGLPTLHPRPCRSAMWPC